MASGWLWQSNEAPTHCVFHYPNAPRVALPAPQCYSHVSSDNGAYNFTTTYGFASVAPSYPAFSTQCVQVTFVRKPRVLGEHQPDETHAAATYVPAQPPGPGPGTGPPTDQATGPPSRHVPDPGPSQITGQSPTLILVTSSAGVKHSPSLSEQEGDNERDKSLHTHAKRLRGVRPRARMSQQASTEHRVRKVPLLRTGGNQRVAQERWVMLARPRRVTKRVNGIKTPQPYQRKRKTLIQRQLLQIPGDRQLYKHVNLKTKLHHYAILAADYEQDVMNYLLEVEKRHVRTHNYLTLHPSVSQRTRAILVDWLIQVQSYLGVSRETLYQAVAMVDRVLEECCIPVHRVQLLAVTCLLIASKLEEQQAVETAELLNLTLNSYTHQELLTLERRVLSVLNFKLTYADPTVFLGYFLYLTCNTQDQTVNDCCGFLMEVVMVESWPLETRPSLLAAAALHGALMVIYGTLAASAVPLLMPKYFNLKEKEIVATSLRLLEALTNRFHLPFQGAESKYASQSRHQALAHHPRLQPIHLLSVVDKVRESLIQLRGENTVIRTTQHVCPGEPPWCLPKSASLTAGNTTQNSGASVKEQHVVTDTAEDGGILV